MTVPVASAVPKVPVVSVIEARFARLLAGIVGLGAAVRLLYVLTDHRPLIGGDGLAYRLDALRIADGQGYTSGFGNVGTPTAHHPPAWVTVLAAVSWLGGRSELAHQLVGVVIGLGVIAVAGLVGRRYFNERVGLIAAVVAALYPGFWVLEGNVLSEPLTLLLIGILTLAIAGLKSRPTLGRSAAVGALCGLTALARSEELALLVVMVVPVLIGARAVSMRRRTGLIAVAIFACAVVLAPWTIYNATRFKAPVFLSTNDGSALLLGNCPPRTYSGRLLGYHDGVCLQAVALRHPHDDGAQFSLATRGDAISNALDNLDRMPIVVPARIGRTFALFRPSQTVGLIAGWMTTDSSPIWAWVVSYWLIAALAVVGFVSAWRANRFVLPLIAPLIIAAGVVVVVSGEPRFHTPSDLGVVVLSAAGIEWIWKRSRARSPGRHDRSRSGNQTRKRPEVSVAP